MWRSGLTDVDPFVIKWPNAWLTDPEVGPVVQYLNRFLHDLWLRTGGGDDAITEVQIGELYETGIESATVTELEQELNDYDFYILPEPEDVDEPNYTTERVWDKRRVSGNTYASDYSMLSVSGGKTVYLPAYPDVNSEVIVINEDGQSVSVEAQGNDIRIRGTTDKAVDWSEAGQSINFYWFEDGPWWVAI
jgi:hypothetical protein